MPGSTGGFLACVCLALAVQSLPSHEEEDALHVGPPREPHEVLNKHTEVIMAPPEHVPPPKTTEPTVMTQRMNPPEKIYTAPFLAYHGYGEPEEILDVVLDDARAGKFMITDQTRAAMADTEVHADGIVPPQHAMTMSHKELVQALEGMDAEAADMLDTMSDDDMRQRLMLVLANARSKSPTMSTTPSSSPTPSTTAELSPSGSPSVSTEPSDSAQPEPSPPPPPPPVAEPPVAEPQEALPALPSSSPPPLLETETPSPSEEPVPAEVVTAETEGKTPATTTPTPVEEECDDYGGMCAMILITGYALVSGFMFIVQLINPDDEPKGFTKLLPSSMEPIGESLDEAFNMRTLSFARKAMYMTPVAAVLMVFLCLRVCHHELDISGADYATLKTYGFAGFTLGTGLIVMDALGLRLDGVCGNLNQTFGTLAMIVGYCCLIWGVVEVREHDYSSSMPEVCIVLLSVFLLIPVVCLLSVQWVKGHVTVVDTDGFGSRVVTSGLDLFESAVSESKLEEILSTCAFAPMFLIVYIYYDVYHMDAEAPEITHREKQVLGGSVAGVYILGLMTLLRSTNKMDVSRVTLLIRSLVLVLVYGSLMGLVYTCLDQADTSKAATSLLVLIMCTSVLKIAVLFTQDATHTYLNDVDNGKDAQLTEMSNEEKASNLLTLTKDMLRVSGTTEALCILLAYLHYKPLVLLQMDSDEYINEREWVPQGITLATVAVFIQLAALLFSACLGKASLFNCLQFVGLCLFQVGIGMCAVAALT